MKKRRYLVTTLLVLITAQAVVPQKVTDELGTYNDPASRMRGVIERFDQDRDLLDRYWTAGTSANRANAFAKLYSDQLAVLSSTDFEKLNHDEQIDYILFKNYLDHELKEQARQNTMLAEMSSVVPFAKTISDLEDSRRQLNALDPAKAAATLNDLAKAIVDSQKSFESGGATNPKRTVANRAARTAGELRGVLRRWYGYYNAYDPMFTWWCEAPYKTADDALGKYQTYITEKLVGIKADDKTTIIGDPIGREALIQELQFEMIPYSPEELIEIANKEFEWCQTELKKASREMGFGDDYMKAIEAVKQKYVEPGKQPELIKKLAYEAIEYVEKNDLVTVPKAARDGWRMEMMTPERQLIAPFFFGRRDDISFISDRWYDARAKDDVDARQ